MASQMASGVKGAPDATSDYLGMVSGVRGAFDAISDSSGMTLVVREAFDVYVLRRSFRHH
uniref:Uncharacterized protein n=1 Tax=Cucumis melo TaxID=3656 RepID=A0A9I9DM25_CUCME